MSDGVVSDGETVREAQVRQNLLEKRSLKRSKDRAEYREHKVITIDDDDEHFSIQPERKHPRVEPPKRPLSETTANDHSRHRRHSRERDHDRDHHKSSRHHRRHRSRSRTPEKRDRDRREKKHHRTRSPSPTIRKEATPIIQEKQITPPSVSPGIPEKTTSSVEKVKAPSSVESDPNRGLSSSPDSFADAGVSPQQIEVPNGTSAVTPIPEEATTPRAVSKAHSTVEEVESPEKPPIRPIGDDEIREVILDDLTDEQRAALSPEQFRRLDERTQRHYISKLPKYYPGLRGCRSVSEYNCLNKIDEGTFGIVYRAQEKRTGEICALKRLKLERERDGFPITSLREVNLLLMCRDHPNVVNVKEIVVGNHMDKVYLVMEYVEHDLKALVDQLAQRGHKFTTAQIKTLTQQLLAGLDFMHHNWMVHRDLKTSNLLLSHKGVLKIGDFGLARTYGQPLKPFTPVVVTLWYRSPELLLETKTYSTAVDMWSVGCIVAEFFKLKPLFRGSGEIDQLNKIFYQLGSPSVATWPEYETLPLVKKCTFKDYPYNQLRKQFGSDVISEAGLSLLNGFFIYNPRKRLSADEALQSPWFEEQPLPLPPELFPTWPARSEHGKVPPPSRAPPPEPEVTIELDDSTKQLCEQYNIDPRKVKRSNGPYVPRFR
uniref:cyclin-dependent kinase n=1 Tax=Panagrellus redivivus TaxID=6233 RepID=A0A7E4VC90_PANRE